MIPECIIVKMDKVKRLFPILHRVGSMQDGCSKVSSIRKEEKGVLGRAADQ